MLILAAVGGYIEASMSSKKAEKWTIIVPGLTSFFTVFKDQVSDDFATAQIIVHKYPKQ
jgi:hypothetical protein